MDFLKSAVASAISKGPAFPYSFGDRVDIDSSIWTLHNGTKREDSSKCSIFSFDVTANKSRLPLARNALRKLRTLRHPGVIKVLDTVETDAYIYIATERLTPLGWHTRRKSLAEETLKWGLHSIAKTLKFINGDATSVHGCLRVSSVFTSESGEWKLGGFELLSSMKEDDAIIYNHGGLVPDSGRYMPPEIVRSGWEAIKRNPVHVVDAYQLGILIFEAFNGGTMGSDEAGQTKGIPPSMHQSYKRLFSQNPKARISVSQFLEQGQRNGGFFQTPLIQITEDIESLGLKADSEKDEFLSQLDEVADDFPEEFFKMKVLPELLKSVEFGGGGPKAFGVIMKISQKLSEDEYDSSIIPFIVRLFSSPDRALRVCLLDNLPLMIDHLSQKIVTDKIFPQMVTGFTDVAPVVREQTVKGVLVVVPKLSDRIVNGELLRYLAKTANDEQPGIRTNTTICLGKIARNLGANTRAKVLSAAFSRSLRDPFVHARNAALMALAATCELFTPEDCAAKLLPLICPSLVDKEKIVRDSANKSFELFLQRIRKHAQTMPDSVLPPPTGPGAAANAPRVGTPQADSSSWAGWAISSFTNKLTAATGEIQPSATAGATLDAQRASSVPLKSPSSPLNPSTLASSRGTTLNKSSGPTNPFITPASGTPSITSGGSEIEQEDFGAAWGDDLEDTTVGTKDNKSSANDSGWGNGWDEDPADAFNATPSSTTKATTNVSYDDGGEPDFAGWLAAQNKAKQKPKSTLPKGLAKSSAATRPSALKSNSTGNVMTTKKATVTARAKPTPAPQKKEEPKKVEEEDDDWGDAWG